MRALLLTAVLALAGCSGYLPFAGGALEGEVHSLPASWTEVSQTKIVQLETNPAEPYSVNIWCVGEGEKLYVFAGDNKATWIEHMLVDPAVRLKIDERIYELRAQRVTDAEEFEWFAQQWDKKYGNRPRNEKVGETYLMRLTPR